MSGARVGAVALALCLAAACAAPAPGDSAARSGSSAVWFEEVSGPAGLEFQHSSGHAGRPLFPEIIGGGAALFDMDGDGDLDAYLVQSGTLHEPAGNARNENRLFVNVGGGRFEPAPASSGAGDRGYGMGVAAGDYDNDGDVDLYVTNYGPNVLLRNDGQGRFADVTEEAGVGDPSWSTSAAFLDYDNDGDLDLFVANYVNWAVVTEQDCYNPSGVLDYCLPTNYDAPAIDRLYRNEGDGSFADVTEAAGLLAASGNGLGVVAANVDGDGWTDIFVANDTMVNQLWMNQGGTRFRDEALLRGSALDEHGMAKAGMGVAAADTDDDGDEDVLVVNLGGQTDSYFLNEAGYFVDRTGSVGLGTTGRRFTRFGVAFVDFDNDGVLDLYEANGRVVQTPEPTTADPYAEPDLVLRGNGRGGFEELQLLGGTAEPIVATSRAAAFGDVDGDGGVDVLVVNRDGPAHLLRNVVPGRGRWIRFRVLEEHGRDAFGATVSLNVGERRITRTVRAAYGYCASHDPRVHVGVGAQSSVKRVQVRWPGGAVEEFGDFDVDRDVELRRGAGR